MSEERISLRAIFNQALEIADAHRRAEYLAQVCGADTALRQSIEELIQANQDAGKFLSRPGDSGSAAQRPSSSTVHLATISEKAGDKIGRYKLLQKIGEGGCGIVYMAEQEEPVRRRVALKVIKLGMDTKSVIARFEAERQALALMDHPNIAKVLDAGATETGRPYFVMELVKGVRITDYCDQNNLTTIQRLALFTSVCHAIQHAHQKGIIHRDIKPSNILVTMHDGVPVPKVIDFGIAKATTDQRLTDKTLFTAFEQFIGTPAYMSPEQAEMSGLDIDTRSDIYALGVLLYELLTGKPPFDGKELLASGLDAMRRTIREKEPARPSTRLSTMTAEDLTTIAKHRQTEAAKLTSSIRGDLDWIVMKALEKDRTRRYETANGLATDIQRHLKNEPVVARPPGNVYRLQKLVRRNKLVFAGIGAVAAALLMGLGVSTWLLFKERAARQRAVLAEGKAQTEASKSEQVADFLKKMLQGVGPSQALGRDTTMLREILDETAKGVGKDLTSPEVELELRSTLANTYHELGLYKEMEAMARRSLVLARARPGEANENLASALTSLGDALMHLGKMDESERFTREAMALRKNPLGKEPKLSATISLALLAHILSERGDWAEAENIYRQALALQKKLDEESQTVATTLNNLAGVLENERKLAEAETLSRQALAIRQKLFPNPHPDTASSLHSLGTLFFNQNKLPQAETMLRQALAMRQKLLGEEHPALANTIHNLAVVLCDEGKYPQAEELEQKALAMRRKLLGNEHRDVAHALRNLSKVLWRQGKLPQAETSSRELLERDRQRLSKEHPEIVEALAILAHVLALQGKLTDAEPFLREALEIVSKKSPGQPAQETFDLGLLCHHLADVRRQQKDLPEALSLAKQAYAMYERHPDWLPEEQVHSARVLADVLRDLGDLSALDTLYREQLTRVRKSATNAPSGETSNLGVALYEWADVLRERKSLAEAQSMAEEAFAAYQRHPDWPANEREHSVEVLTEVLRDHGDFSALEALLRDELSRARTLSTNAPSGETSNLGRVLYHLAIVLRERKALTEARSLAEDAAAMYRHHPEWPLGEQQDAFAVLADVLRDVGDFREREALLREELSRARRLAASVPSGETSNLGRALYHLAILLRERKALPEAQSLAQEAVAMFQRHPDWPLSKRQHAVEVLETVLRDGGDFAGLEALLRDELGRLRELSTNAPSGQDSSFGVVMCHLAEALRKRKTFAEAHSLAEEGADLYRHYSDWPPEEREYAFEVLAAVRMDRGDASGAEAAYREELQSFRARLPSDDPLLASMLAQLTMTLLEEKKFAQAEPFARECLQIREKKIPDDWLTFNSRSLLGGALLGQKQFAAAEPMLLSGYEGMKQREDKISAAGKPRLKETFQRLVQLYEATGRPDEAAEWKKQLAERDKTER